MILDFDKLKAMLEVNLSCKKCETEKENGVLENFAAYLLKHANKNVYKELKEFKQQTLKRGNDVLLTKETIGLSTSLTCRCSNGCEVNIPHEKVFWGIIEVRKQAKILN